jgi:hypothetical protein
MPISIAALEALAAAGATPDMIIAPSKSATVILMATWVYSLRHQSLMIVIRDWR